MSETLINVTDDGDLTLTYPSGQVYVIEPPVSVDVLVRLALNLRTERPAPGYTTPGDPAERLTLEPTDLPEGTTGVLERGSAAGQTLYVCEDHDRRSHVDPRTGDLVHRMDGTTCRT